VTSSVTKHITIARDYLASECRVLTVMVPFERVTSLLIYSFRRRRAPFTASCASRQPDAYHPLQRTEHDWPDRRPSQDQGRKKDCPRQRRENA
jgi:hypothetical protein